MKKILRSPFLWTVLVVFLLARTITPAFILNQTNKFLSSFSQTYLGHIEDFDISLWRGAYSLEGFSLKLKQAPEEEFVYASRVDISLAWRELFAGKINTDIVIEQMKLVITNKVVSIYAKKPDESKDDSKKAAKTLFPIKIERIDVKDSVFEFADLLSLPEAQRWRMTKLEGRLSNITSDADLPISFFLAQGALFDSSAVKVRAQLNLLKEPMAWDVDLELKNFNLPNANGWLKRKLPLTFTSGKLNLYSEVRSQNSIIQGYVKPFLHKADVVANSEVFSGFKHFAIEISAATANLILRTARDKTLATKVVFSYNKDGLKLNSVKAISAAIKNGFSEKIPEGLDNEISLNKISRLN